MWKLANKEREAVLKLEPFKRYTYSIKRIADTETVYSLRHKDGTWALAELDNRTLLSIWPHADFAQSAVAEEWEGYGICEIPLEEFTDAILPSFDPALLINVFSIADKSGFVVDQQELLRDLKEELSNY